MRNTGFYVCKGAFAFIRMIIERIFVIKLNKRCRVKR